MRLSDARTEADIAQHPVMGVLQEVYDERVHQDERFGEQDRSNGTHAGFEEYATRARQLVDSFAPGTCPWFLILCEEFFEAGAETDTDALRKELIQVAAVAIAWVENIDRRRAAILAPLRGVHPR